MGTDNSCQMKTVLVVVMVVVVQLLSTLVSCTQAQLQKGRPTLPLLSAGLAEGKVAEVRGVVGGMALLPCDVTEPGDSPILVLFYNGATGRPVYSIDARSGTLDTSVHWSGLGKRAHFDLSSSTQSLFIHPVEAEDQGDYRCRVDFRASPTRNLRVTLEVVVPPQRVSITNAAGLEVSGVIGPYPVGGSLTLTCQALGGRPAPLVTWWHDGLLLDDKSEKNTSEVTQNRLTLPLLTRQHLYRVITCQAANSNLSQPLHTSITLDMSFPPLEVKIQGHNSPMSEGRHYSLMCEAGGSRPPAALTWWMDGLLMTTADDQGMKEGNVSRTTVHLTPTRHNDGAIVSCRAENSEMPGAAMEDIIKLSVYYSPRLQLRAGQNLVMSNIKEGDDVYFECVIHANPPVQGVQWFLKGKELRHDVSAGIILTNQSLVLQKVGRQSSGDYACAASNTHGNATSKSIQLSVKFAPMCSEDQKLTYGSARGQQVNVSCHVDAHPEAHTFRWAFNTSTEVVHIPKNRTHFHRNRSVMTYTPKTHHDFGTLLCWASNDVGSQPQPCVYLVVPAAVPEAVHNCSAWHNASAAGEVVVSCEAGWSGGLTQTFTLEVRQMQSSGETGAVVASLEQLTQPHFTVTGLAPGAEYQLSVGASNSQGAAPNTLLIHHTPIDVAEKRTSAAAAESFGMGLDFLTMVPIVAVVAGAVASVVICSVVLVLVIRSRLRRGQNHAHSHAHGFSQPGGVYDKAAPHNNTCDDGGFDTVHRGPDLILVKSGREDRKRPGISPLTCSPSTATTLMGDQQVGSSSTVNNPARISTPNVIPARTSTPSVIPARTSTPSVIPARTSTPSVIPARTETNTSASTNHRSLVNPSTGAMINPSTGTMINPSTGTMINPSTGTMINPSIGPDVKGLSSGDALMNAGPEALMNTSGNSAMFEMGSGGPPFGRITLSGDPLDSRMTRPGGLLVDGRITLSGDPLDNRVTRTGDILDSRMPRSRDHSLEGRIARPVSVASPATLGRYHTRVGRSASCTGRGDIFSSTSTLPRRSSAIDIQPEFFPLNLSTSRESCV